MEPALISIRHAAVYLACSPWTIRDLIWKGEIDVVPLGKRQMLRREDLDSMIDRLKTRAGSGQTTGKGHNGKKRA